MSLERLHSVEAMEKHQRRGHWDPLTISDEGYDDENLRLDQYHRQFLFVSYFLRI